MMEDVLISKANRNGYTGSHAYSSTLIYSSPHPRFNQQHLDEIEEDLHPLRHLHNLKLYI